MEEKIIKHFLHEHPLKLQQISIEKAFKCEGCRKWLCGQIYGCKNCKFFLHKNCALLPRVKQHFCHPCPLILGIACDCYCNTCGRISDGFTYHCEQCCFHLHIKCLEMKPISSTAVVSGSESERIYHFVHSHPLTRFTDDELKFTCRFCGMDCLGPGYVCQDCEFYIHRSCVDILTPTIEHASHPCPLILVPLQYSNQCSTCDNECGGLVFICGKCSFYLCSVCFLMPAIRSNENEMIECRFMGSRFILREIKVTTGDYDCDACTICYKICSGPAYVDEDRKLFHPSCVKIPEQIENHYHSPLIWNDSEGSNGDSHSSLISLLRGGSSRKCDSCLKWSIYKYSCSKCSFYVGTECIFLKPTVRYKRHRHPLTVIGRIESMDGEPRCNHCHAPCEDASPAFRCVQCDFTLHLLCGPLPCSIKIKCHVHPLTLKEFVTEDGPNDDNYCCHVCEQRRNPRSPVYYCSDCRFVAEANCVMSEVIAMLEGECGAVELRNLGGVIKTKVITGETIEAESNCSPLDNMLHSFQEQQPKEYEELMGKISTRRKEKPQMSSHKEDESTSDGEIYSDEHFEEFIDELNAAKPLGNLKDFMLEQDEEFATLGNYWVARVHIPIMKALFAKYGDISHKSKLSPEVKSLYFLVLCGVIYKMGVSLADNVTEEQLHDWWSFLKFVEKADFEIQFMFDQLRRVAIAHYGFRSQKFNEDGIKRLSGMIIELQRAMETVKGKLERFKNATRSQLMAECHDQALGMKLKPAANGLL